MASTVYYVIKECPFKEHCSHRAFKNARCWGETDAEARSSLERHLRFSQLHRDLAEDVIVAAVHGIMVAEEEWESTANDPQEPRAKRGRGSRGDSAQSQEQQGVEIQLAMHEIAASAAAAVVREVGLARPAPQQPSFPPPMQPVPFMMAAEQQELVPYADTVVVRRELLKGAVDALERAAAAASHARTILEDGAAAFEEEGRRIRSAAVAVKRALNSA